MLYRTICADPAWPEDGKGMYLPSKDGNIPIAAHPYPLMSYADITALPIHEMAAPLSHLYLWATQRSLRYAFGVMEAWGFEYKMTLTWCKAGLGMGFQYYRHSSEFVLFGARGNLATKTRNTGTWFLGKKGRHSRKPDDFFTMVEENSYGPYLELFARETRPGWHTVGNELDGLDMEEVFAGVNVNAVLDD